MVFNRFKLLVVFLVIIAFSLSFAGEKKPDWVTKHPTSKLYYIGIAVIKKSPDNKDYIQKAKDAALNNLASQIAVNISSEIFQAIIEGSGMVEDVLKKHIQTSTKAELEGFELVDTWEDKSDYWVYYQLSRELYADKQQKKLNKATDLALDLFSKGKSNEQDYKVEKALLFYLQALSPIEKYLSEPLKVNYNESDIYLANEIYSSIQNLLTRTGLRPTQYKMKAKIGQPLEMPIDFQAVYITLSGDEFFISDLPLVFSFTKGSGDFVKKVRTDKQGIAKCQVSKIKSNESVQIIKAELDMESLINLDEASLIIQGIVKSFPLPAAQVLLDVSSITAYITTSEIHFGGELDVLAIEPALKKTLSQFGFSFTSDNRSADYIINIEAQSRKGSEIVGDMYSSYVDLTITVYDKLQGNELYKRSLHDVKGIDLSFDKSGRKAFTNAGQQVREEIVPDLLRTIQR